MIVMSMSSIVPSYVLLPGSKEFHDEALVSLNALITVIADSVCVCVSVCVYVCVCA